MAGELLREPALPDAGLAGDERHSAPTAQRTIEGVSEDRQLPPSADERLGPGLGLGCGRPAIKTGVLREDRPLQLLQLAPGLDPELLYQDTARVGVRLERVRLAPRAVEGEDQQRAEALAQRVVEDQALELSRQLRVPAQLELGGEVLLQDGRAQLFESSDFALGKRGVSHVRERRPAPQRQALGQ